MSYSVLKQKWASRYASLVLADLALDSGFMFNVFVTWS